MSQSDTVARALALAEESFIASSGPGGQNVNKVATAVQLRLDVFALRLSPPVFHRLKVLAGSRMTARGEIVLTALARRVRQIHLEGPPVIHYNNSVRGYTSMPVSVTAA